MTDRWRLFSQGALVYTGGGISIRQRVEAASATTELRFHHQVTASKHGDTPRTLAVTVYPPARLFDLQLFWTLRRISWRFGRVFRLSPLLISVLSLDITRPLPARRR